MRHAELHDLQRRVGDPRAGEHNLGRLSLAVGLGSRLFAFLLAADMAVAYWIADHQALLAFFSDPDKFSAAAPFTFLFASLIVLIFGPGKLALDTLIAKRFAPAARRAVTAVPA